MAAHAPPAELSEHDFETIEDAVMETARGRWFLREYARRMRSADTNRLLDALSRIERVVSGQSAPVQPDTALAFHLDLLGERRDRLAELSTSLREQGYDGDLCGRIAREAMAIDEIIHDIRGGEVLMEARSSSPSMAPRSSDPAVHNEDPHADAPVTIEAVVAEMPPDEAPEEVHPLPDLPAVAASSLQVDLSALEAVEALPRAERLALFS